MAAAIRTSAEDEGVLTFLPSRPLSILWPRRYIIGKKDDTRKRLEAETQTSISIPKQGVEGQIVISGQQRASVISACSCIEVLTESFHRKQPFTHFLSFALNQPEMQERYMQFKEEVLKNCSQDNGVDGSIFQNPAKLHLTIGTQSLLNEKEVTKACEFFHQMFGKYHFGNLDLYTVQVSQRFSTDSSGYYTSSGLITFS
ncbi:activating signal cointegrator 1 complex subunit 1 [Acipenser oxyrinchus oxyrinchus]|uniref:Activating signal cointegrator 1 complex subunit 1 n=1 Tax=Acipenser oxyrinchus oxyrinchus TaxID=40147 RepID=A0AAD8G0Y3_ACIOX|nr:activating signal cointegrator 1 complex subunit 1 [Acipenser oxyrinchus oxyrinchus]